jgi:hypothetical protein
MGTAREDETAAEESRGDGRDLGQLPVLMRRCLLAGGPAGAVAGGAAAAGQHGGRLQRTAGVPSLACEVLRAVALAHPAIGPVLGSQLPGQLDGSAVLALRSGAAKCHFGVTFQGVHPGQRRCQG